MKRRKKSIVMLFLRNTKRSQRTNVIILQRFFFTNYNVMVSVDIFDIASNTTREQFRKKK